MARRRFRRTRRTTARSPEPDHSGHIRRSGGETSLTFAEAESVARTGDIWLFRGRSIADHAIRAVTNSPVNHVGMVVALDDLPPLLWHAELGRSIPDVYTGRRQRGTQLHRLADAVGQWHHRYGQDAWVRQLDAEITTEIEDQIMFVIDELDGRAFRSTAALATGWLKGRLHRRADSEQLFCAEVVALTYQRMGLLGDDRPSNWYDPGKFWSGDHLDLQDASLGPEVAVHGIPEFVWQDAPDGEPNAAVS